MTGAALVMRKRADQQHLLDRYTRSEIREYIENADARLADGDCSNEDRRELQRQVAVCQIALRPDYSETIHDLTCRWLQRYQEGRWTPLDEVRAFMVVPIDELPSYAVPCEYCFGGRWPVGIPTIPEDELAIAFPDGDDRRRIRNRARGTLRRSSERQRRSSPRRGKPDPAWMTDQAIEEEFAILIEQRKASTQPGVKAALTKRLNWLFAEAERRVGSTQSS